MKIKLRIIDQDLSYAENLAAKLRERLQSIDIVAITIPLFVEANELETTIDLFTEDQYPSYKPENCYITITSENPFISVSEKNKPTDNLSRFSPIKMFVSSIEAKILEIYPNYFESNLISSFIIEENSRDLLQNIALEISNTSKINHKFILNLGPDTLFPKNEKSMSLSISKLLLKISLRNFDINGLGEYLEISPLSSSLMRFTLTENHDDWILASDTLVREAIETIKSWLDENYEDKWELYLISINMPHKINLLLSSLSQKLRVYISDFQKTDDKYISELIGNLPKDSTYEIKRKQI